MARRLADRIRAQLRRSSLAPLICTGLAVAALAGSPAAGDELSAAIVARGAAPTPVAAIIGPDPDDDPDLDCLLETRVTRFSASPTVVQPFASTTVSSTVSIPPGCRVSLSLAGRQITPSAVTVLTPLAASTRYDLIARFAGGQATLASLPVSVDTSQCTSLELPEVLIAPQIESTVASFDEASDDLEIEVGLVSIDAAGLRVTLVVDVFKFGLRFATVDLEMRLDFTVRGGHVEPRFTLFRPIPGTVLPDEFVTGRVFAMQDEILAAFDAGINAALEPLRADDDRIFELGTATDVLQYTACPFAPPRLDVRLTVSPASDAGRFNLRVDGQTVRANARNGASTGPRAVSAGRHTVSIAAGSGTRLADYRRLIGGSCSASGVVNVPKTELRTCRITMIRQSSPDQCRSDCADERNICNADGFLTPAICAQLYNQCLATCG